MKQNRIFIPLDSSDHGLPEREMTTNSLFDDVRNHVTPDDSDSQDDKPIVIRVRYSPHNQY